MTDYQQTFGPVVIEWDDNPGTLVAKCQSGRFDCRGRVGTACVWHEHVNGEARKLPSDMLTPNWCEYKASALADVEEMRGRHE